jgi:Fur family transcriptional regulator, ferric uptake regulator
VAELLAEKSAAMTAEGIMECLPEVHPSSVYRTLNVLEELGYVRHVHLAHGAALYELADRVSTVRHLVCELCGRTVEVPLRTIEPLRRKIEKEYGFVLDSAHFAMTGRCSGCVRPEAN